MAHELEIVDGQARMIYVGPTPWHSLGIKLLESPKTVREAGELCHATDEVMALDMSADLIIDGVVTPIACEDRKMIVRKSDNKFIASVGYDYEIIQAYDIFKQAQPAIDAGYLSIETMGVLRGGSRPWMQCRINGTTADIVANDTINAYMLFFLSHDGTLSAGSVDTATRVVCQNTLNCALGEAWGRAIKIRHTKNAAKGVDKIGEAIEAKRLSFAHSVDAFRTLARVQLNAASFAGYIASVFEPEIFGRLPVDTGDSKKDAENAEKRANAASNLVTEIAPLFEKGRGNDMPGVKGTAWGALNAVSEYLTWERGKSNDTRLDALWFGRGANTNQRAFTQALKLAA